MKSKYSLEHLKEYIEGANAVEELNVGYITEITNRIYYHRSSPNFDRPDKCIHLCENQKLVIKDNRIMKSGLEYEHYGVYEKDGGLFLFRDQRGWFMELHPHEPESFMKNLGFRFIRPVSIAFEVITPVHEIESAPKNADEVNRFQYSVEKYKRPLRAVYFNTEDEGIPFPELIATYSSFTDYRLSAQHDWKRYSYGIIPDKDELMKYSDDMLLRHTMELYVKKFENPLIDKSTEHIKCLIINTTNVREKPDFSLITYSQGDKEKLEKDENRRLAKKTLNRQQVQN